MLDDVVIINGIFSLIFVVVCIIVGLLIFSQYFKLRDRNLLLVGIAWMGLSEPWLPSSISFLVALVNGKGLTLEVYIFLGNFFLPLTLMAWLIAMTDLLVIEKKKTILIACGIFVIFFEIFMIYYILTDPSFLGELVSPVDIDYTIYAIVLLFANLLIFFITGFLFVIKSIQSEIPKIRLKGKLLLVAFICFLIGTALDLIATTPLFRLILVLSAIIFYMGYILPKPITKLFLKKED